MKNKIIITISIVLTILLTSCKEVKKNEAKDYAQKLDSLLETKTTRPFNGVILIAENDSISYQKTYGYSDFENKIPISTKDQYVIGSLSKQITAVLVLKSFEEGKLDLKDPIKKFMPSVQMSWADSVTLHHLLNHTHGINELNKQLKFKAGKGFSYSNLGYDLLGEILEGVNGKTYATLTRQLFKKAGMKNSSDPSVSDKKRLVNGHSKHSNGKIEIETETFTDESIPAGLLLSNASDLYLWNKALHSNKLLLEKTYQTMLTPSATQNHSLFGMVGYAYGLRVSNENDIEEIGHTGYVPGFISMNFYYPNTKTSIIVLENLDWNDDDIKNTFYFELKIRKIIRDSKLVKKTIH